MALTNKDDTQVLLMKEPCILVNDQDEEIGSDSKKECHLLQNIKKGYLHRAFSVFLFNTNNELLLQQRSDAKITFPGHYTNTCCSHPLFTDLERDNTEAIGVRRAARRKLHHELGISPDQVSEEDLVYLTRVQYCAGNQPADGIWGENEIDYILFCRKNVDININENEVKSYNYFSQEKLKTFLESAGTENRPITPWFRMIADTFLFDWWDKLDDLDSVKDHKTIHKFKSEIDYGRTS